MNRFFGKLFLTIAGIPVFAGFAVLSLGFFQARPIIGLGFFLFAMACLFYVTGVWDDNPRVEYAGSALALFCLLFGWVMIAMDLSLAVSLKLGLEASDADGKSGLVALAALVLGYIPILLTKSQRDRHYLRRIVIWDWKHSQPTRLHSIGDYPSLLAVAIVFLMKAKSLSQVK
jgi:hypothetical protein